MPKYPIARALFAAILILPPALRADMPAIISIGAEEIMGSSGRLPSIATDSQNQPHAAWDGGAYCYFYDRIGGVWQSSSVNSGSYNSKQYYNPHIEIDRDNTAWSSGILIGTQIGIGVIVRTTVNTTPGTAAFSAKHEMPSSWDTGNLSLDLDTGEAIVWVSGGYWGSYTYDATQASLTRKTGSGRMYCGIGGEANRIWVSRAGKVAHADGVTRSVRHVATEAHSGYGLSYYQNSIRHAKSLGSVAWANPASYSGMGTDGSYVGVCGDNIAPEVAYIACDLSNDGGQGGIYANVFNGTAMTRSTSDILIVDRSGSTGMRRFEPDMAPAKNGGAFIIWQNSGRIYIRYLSSNGAMGPVKDICSGTRGAICTDSQGNIHIAYVNNSKMCYRKLLVTTSAEWLTIPADFNHDGADDVGVYDPTNGNWYTTGLSGSGVIFGFNFGGASQTPAPGDYDGDGWGDLATFNQTSGVWNIWSPHRNKALAANLNWGYAGTQPVQGDYDGDGRDDLAVYANGSGNWYIWSLAKHSLLGNRAWGFSGARAVPGDYDGDGRDDLAVYDSYSGKWYIRTFDLTVANGTSWGWAGATALRGDFDGDSFTDLAVFNPAGGKWFIYSLRRNTKLAWNYAWGWSDTTPVVGNFDGDRADDLAVYDRVRGEWYIRSLARNKTLAWRMAWGAANGKPFAGDFDRDGVDDLCVYNSAAGLWYIKTISGAVLRNAYNWGWSGATAMVADFDGDRADDLAVYGSSTHQWFIRSVYRNSNLAWKLAWGVAGVQTAPDDYDGDGAADLALYGTAKGQWYVYSLKRNTTLTDTAVWGTSTMKPMGGDYDGDGRADLALFDTASGKWHIKNLELVLVNGLAWGGSAMIPIPGDFNGDGRSDIAVCDPAEGRWYIRSLAGQTLAWNLNWGWNTVTYGAGDYDGDHADDLVVFEPSGLWFIYSLRKNAAVRWNYAWGYRGVVPLGTTSK